MTKEWRWKTLHNFGSSTKLRQGKEDDEIWDEEQILAFMTNVVKAVHEFEKSL